MRVTTYFYIYVSTFLFFSYSLKGHMIASCDSCGVTKLWDFRKLLPIVSIDVGPSPGNEVNFDSSGRILFSTCDQSKPCFHSVSPYVHFCSYCYVRIHYLISHTFCIMCHIMKTYLSNMRRKKNRGGKCV